MQIALIWWMIVRQEVTVFIFEYQIWLNDPRLPVMARYRARGSFSKSGGWGGGQISYKYDCDSNKSELSRWAVTPQYIPHRRNRRGGRSEYLDTHIDLPLLGILLHCMAYINSAISFHRDVITMTRLGLCFIHCYSYFKLPDCKSWT